MLFSYVVFFKYIMPILLPSKKISLSSLEKKISLSIEIGFVGYICLVISNRNSHITLLFFYGLNWTFGQLGKLLFSF